MQEYVVIVSVYKRTIYINDMHNYNKIKLQKV